MRSPTTAEPPEDIRGDIGSSLLALSRRSNGLGVSSSPLSEASIAGVLSYCVRRRGAKCMKMGSEKFYRPGACLLRQDEQRRPKALRMRIKLATAIDHHAQQSKDSVDCKMFRGPACRIRAGCTIRGRSAMRVGIARAWSGMHSADGHLRYICTGTAHFYDSTDSKRPRSSRSHHGRYCHRQRGPDDAAGSGLLICARGAARLVVPELRLLGEGARRRRRRTTHRRRRSAQSRDPRAAL